MTCIVGIEHKGKVYLGGDSAASNTWSIATRSEPKAWLQGDFAFAICGSFRYGAIVRHAFVPPAIRGPIDRYLHKTFVPALREAFKADMDLQDTNSGKYPDLGMLVGVKGRLYEFHSDFQFGRPRDGFTALGSGGDVAQGALYASAKRPVRERLLTALNAAERYTTFVRAPFTIVSI